MKSFARLACACVAILFGANAQLAFAVPTVSLTAPAANANFGAPATIAITATATPSSGTTITKVEFFRGGTTLIGTVTASPYTFTWTNVAIGSYSLTAKATDSAGGTKTSTARAIAVSTNVLPTVSISSPAANANFAAPASITINATATDTDGTIAKVEFFNGATLLGTDTTSPYSTTWTGVPVGAYALTAKATDSAGGVKTSTARTVNVVTPPTVSITAPASNATFVAPATVAISASATAAAGATISKVEFFNGATLLGTDTTSPYSFSWTNVAAASYSLTAKATDSKGAATTSAIIPITVTSAPPTVSITSPANNATFAALATIPIAATAIAAAGATINRVEFYNGATLLGQDATSPFTFSWTNVPGGSYTLTAKAIDSKGATKISNPITVTVTAPPPPTVSITAPVNNASFTAPATVALSATATPGSGASITKVEFFNGATLVGTDTTSPYTFSWANVAAGNYTLTAKATDNKGSFTTSAPVAIAVQIPSVPPSVAITAPVSGTSFTAPASFAITATATANAGGATITKVDFYNGATLLGTANTPPYTINLTNRPPGEYLLTAKATDSLGTTATSALNFAVVDGADTCINAPPLAANDLSTQVAALDKLPMTFEVNAGQIDAAVRYRARGPGYQFFLTAEERVLALLSSPRVDAKSREPAKEVNGVAVRMRFVGANKNPAMTGVDPVAQKSHYLVGRDAAKWRTQVAHFAKVRYEGLYPGIDEVYYGKAGKLEYDLHVAPGANPSAVRFALDGVDALALDANGDLLLTTPLGILVQKEPVAYQDIDGQRHAVKAGYQLMASNEVGFRLGAYDSRYPLVIDPVLVYSTYVGGANNASGANAIALSRCGEAFIAGWTYATDFPTTAGAFEPAPVIGADLQMGFVSKLNQSGTGLLYSTYITGTIQDYGDGFPTTQYSTVNSIAVDSTGHAFIAGNTSATDFPTTPGSLYPSPAFAAPSSFAARLNSDGSAFMYSTYMPAGTLAGVAVDGAGSAYIAGDHSVWKLNAVGTALDYSIAVGGAGQSDTVEAIAVDAAGNAVAAGITYSTTPVTTGAFQVTKPTTLPGSPTGFVAKINPSGTDLVYGTYVGTTGLLYLYGVALDAAGNAYVTGSADIKSVIPNFTGTYTSFNQNIDMTGNWYAFVAKLNAAGNSLGYFSRIGGATCGAQTCGIAQTSGNAIAIDPNGSAWITGTTGSNQIPLVKALQSTLAPDYRSLFAAKLSPSGNSILFSTLLGGQTPASPAPNGPGTPDATGIAIDSIGSAYVTGMTNMTDFPTTPGAFQTTLGASAGLSAFVTKINETKDTTTTLLAAPNPAALGSAVTLTANITGNAPTGTVTFLDGAATLGTSTVSASTAVFTTTALTAGVHSLSATFSGDAHNNPSTATTVALNITNPTAYPAVTLTTSITDGATLIANSGPNYSGAQVTVNANAAPGNALSEVRIYHLAGYNYWTTSDTTFTSGFTIPIMGPGYHTINAAAIDNFNHTTATAPIRFVVNSATAVAPTSSITAPANGASYVTPAPIVFTANAVPAGSATISFVYYFDGATQIGVATASPYTFTWTNAPAGTHSIMALAIDSTGANTLSAPITITVTAPTPPAISFTAPANNASYTTPVTIPLTATATAAGSATITKVDFYRGGTTLIGTVTSATTPHTYNWVTVPAGSFALTAKATDSVGSTTTSVPIAITVTAPAVPTVSITAPANGTSFTTPAAVPITTAAAGVNGSTITRVEIYAGATLISTSASTIWNVMKPGTYALTAKAFDNLGATATSAAVGVTIAAAPNETITFLHNDLVGNPIAATDASGNVLWKENYRPYGDRQVNAAAAANNHQWFAGKVVDSETGLSYFGARYYDPVVGRFMGIDAVGFSEGNLQSFNRYAYANNNPYKYVDPDGRASVLATTAAAAELGTLILPGYGTVVGGVVGLVAGGWLTMKAVKLYNESSVDSASGSGAAAGADQGCIYCVKGDKTRSGKDYVGSTDNLGNRKRDKSDGRDREGAEIIDTYAKGDRDARRSKEQQAINDRGGVEKLDNKRNEVAEKKWPDQGIKAPQ